MDPDNSRPFFYSHPQYDPAEHDNTTKNLQDEVREWTDLALGIDRAARILINFAFSQAALNATDKKVLSWLKNAVNLVDRDDLSVVIRLLPSGLDEQDEEKLEQIQQAHEEDLRSKIEKLNTFTELSSFVRTTLINELEEISKEDSSKDNINGSS